MSMLSGSRVFGIIEDGIDPGAHHTLNIETGYDISVIRTWHQSDLERIERAVKGSASDSIHVLLDGKKEKLNYTGFIVMDHGFSIHYLWVAEKELRQITGRVFMIR